MTAVSRRTCRRDKVLSRLGSHFQNNQRKRIKEQAQWSSQHAHTAISFSLSQLYASRLATQKNSEVNLGALNMQNC